MTEEFLQFIIYITVTKYIGRLVELGIAKESTRGAGSAAVYHLPRIAFTFDDKIIQARSVGGLGKLADSEEAFVTTRYGQGDIEGEVRVKSFGLLLYAMLGTLDTTGPTDTSVYTHAFTIADTNTHQSLCFTVDDKNTSEIYQLVMLDSLELTAELDEILRYSSSFMSKKGDATGMVVPATESEAKFTKKHLSFKVATTIGGLAAASTHSLKSINLNISKNVALDDVLGSAEPEDILNRQLAVEGSFTLNYETETWKNYFRDGTNMAMEIQFTNTDETIGATTNPSLTIQMPKVDFFEWEPDYSLDEITSQTVSFKASRDVANSQNIIHLCRLINEVSVY